MFRGSEDLTAARDAKLRVVRRRGYLADGRPEEPPGISPSPFDGVSDCKLSRCTQVRLSTAPGGTIPGPYSRQYAPGDNQAITREMDAEQCCRTDTAPLLA